VAKNQPTRSWKVIFAGSPAYAVPTLTALVGLPQVEVVGVLTQKPKPRGRGQKLQPSAVGAFAESKGLFVLTPASLKRPETQALVTALHADAAVVVAYGKIIPASLLTALPHGWVNAHASLLPRWRGASPIQRALMAGDRETGVTLMQLDAGMDTGPTFASERVKIAAVETSITLADTLATVSAQLLVRNLLPYLEGKAPLSPQPNEGVTLAPLLEKSDGVASFHEPAETLERKIRALQPWPGVNATVNGLTLKILQATVVPGTAASGAVVPNPLGFAIGTAKYLLVPTSVQLPGKKPMSAKAFSLGHPQLFRAR